MSIEQTNPISAQPTATPPKKSGSNVGKLLRDVWRFVWGEDQGVKDLQSDINQIDEARNSKRLAQAKKQQKLEAKARQKAEIKARQAQIRLQLEQQTAQKLLAKQAKKTTITRQVNDKITALKEKTLQGLVKNKQQNLSNQKPLVDHNFLAHGASALHAGLLKPSQHQREETPVRPMQSAPKVVAKKSGWLNKFFAPRPVRQKPTAMRPVIERQPLSSAPSVPVQQPSVHESSDWSKHKEKMAKRLAAEAEKYANLKIRQDIENRYWHSHNIVRANLIKDQETLFFNWQSKILTLVLALGLALLTVGVLYGALLVWESNKLHDNQDVFDNLEAVNQEVKKEEAIAQEIMDFNNKLVLVDYMLDNHIYWSDFFKVLEDYTIFDVYYEGFSGDINGTYALPAVARDYRAVYLQLKLMQGNEEVLSADTEGAKSLAQTVQATGDSVATTVDKIKFILNLVIDRKLFLR
ncbi:MAG: hypothetical protein UT42_C0005G0005 [Candidatus Falkowbacteria bacterium GW2011_GWA2_39_24]|uniref:Uncharacterized protein n=1 Tax=Candidatus Falkowbacteria bacterium GW2011_GWA2_39_24 TaxID=1618634 RepID=A0A0G0QY89_9BACT|nr:MAG: hypothetical protein UT42_C0005G0005 [Candidatus Falkowbacteria bacterium GW2011_GWA2_39_24]